MTPQMCNGLTDIRYKRFNDVLIQDQRYLIVKIERWRIRCSDLHIVDGDRIGK